MTRKARKKEALETILSGPNTVCLAIGDLLKLALDRALTEMESASDNQEMWRAQGKARQLRELLNDLKQGREHE